MKISDEKLDRMLKNEENPTFNGRFVLKASGNPAPGKKGRITAVAFIAAALVLALLVPAVYFALRSRDGGPTGPAVDHVLSADNTSRGTSDSSVEPTGPVTDGTAADTSSETHAADPYVSVNVIKVYTVSSLQQYSAVSFPESSESRLVEGMNEANINRITGGRYINFTSAREGSGHEGHGCLIYDAVEDRLFCATCALAGISGRIPAGENDSVVADNSSTPEKILFSVFSGEEKKISGIFVYDVKSDALTALPVPDLAKNDRNSMAASEDFRFIAVHSYRKTDLSLDDVWLIDTATGEMKTVSGDYPTFALSRFTPDGRFLMSTVKRYGSTEEFDSEFCRFIVTGTGGTATTECVGKILRYSDGKLLTRDAGSAHHLYDLTAGAEIEIPEGTLYWDLSGGVLCLGDAHGNLLKKVEKSVSAYCVSADGNTAFTYKKGSESLMQRGLDGSECKVPLDGSFVIETKKLSETHDLYFSLQEKDGIAVLLYNSVIKPDKPAGSGTQQPVSNSNAFSIVLHDGTTASISDVVTLLTENYPDNDFGYTAALGDGYICVYGETGESYGHKFVMVEDYRDGTFSLYSELMNHGFVRLCAIGPGYFHRRTLSSTREETLNYIRKLTKKNVMTEVNSDIDYAIFYRDGQFSEEAAYDYVFSAEYSGKISFFYAFCGNYGIEVYKNEYKELLSRFMSELAECERVDTVADYGHYGTILTNTGLMIRAEKDRDGNFYVLFMNEDRYKVPEYVYADLVSLAFSGYVSSGFRQISSPEHPEYVSILGGKDSDPMTVAELQKALSGGDLTAEAFADRKTKLLVFDYSDLSETGSALALVAVTDGNGICGYVYLGFSGANREVFRADLFDRDLNYCGDLLTEGFNGFEAKGNIDLPAYAGF
ncbi:MAG: hypothetical protein II534_08795 [Clostridia bacterium]|nr:hypothetical protein [Clostridia bacterium]